MSQSVLSVPAKRVSVLAGSLTSNDEVVEAWVKGRKPDTVRSYLKSLALFCGFSGASPSDLKSFMSGLGAADGNMMFLRFANAMIDAEYASNTIATRLTAIRSFLVLCRTAGWINWTIEVDPNVEAVKYRDTRGPGENGFRKILGAMVGDDRLTRRDRAIIWLLYSPALRRSEVSKLNLADPELDDDPRAMVWQKKRRDQVPITLPDETVAAIRSWLEVRVQCGSCGPDDPLFVSLDRRHFGINKRLGGGSIWKVVVARAKAAGIKTSPHRIRHAAITHALDITNGNVRDVAKFSRHADYRTVQVYDDNRTNVQGKLAAMVAANRQNST
jgi:integrase/recombinase XerC